MPQRPFPILSVLPELRKFSYTLLLCSLLLLSFWGQVVSANDEQASAKQWLERMSSALQKVSYQGVFVYRRDENMATMKVTHVADERGEHELLETLTGEPRREIRNTGHLRQARPDGESPLADIEQFYVLQMVGLDRAAGRFARLLNVEPKDEYRYGYRLWIDQETGLLLRSELIGKEQKILEQVIFTSLELLSAEQIPQALLDQTMPIPEASAVTSLDGLEWIVEHLPPGFELLDHRIKGDEQKIEHMVFSDGLASVSVFVENKAAETESFLGVSNMGAVNAFGGSQDGYHVTVVGEVPQVTVMAIGKSIKRRKVSAND